jgi:hypothetical protein
MAPLLQSATTPSDGDAVVTVRGDLDTETAGQPWPNNSSWPAGPRPTDDSPRQW